MHRTFNDTFQFGFRVCGGQTNVKQHSTGRDSNQEISNSDQTRLSSKKNIVDNKQEEIARMLSTTDQRKSWKWEQTVMLKCVNL